MKKRFTSLFVVLFFLASNLRYANATVGNYSFSQSSGTYTAISGTVLFASTTTGRWDDGESPMQTIPFTFNYNGTNYTNLFVNANGYITLGTTSGTTTNYCGLQASAGNAIAGYGTDLVGGSLATTANIQVATRGTAPNRQYVVQWNDCAHWTSGTYTDHWSFQIILNETTNTVQVVWGNSTNSSVMGANTCADSPLESGSVGIIGNSNADFNIRSVTNGTNTWATSAAGTAISAVCNMNTTNIPVNGLTYTWTPAPATNMSYVSSTTAFLSNGMGVARGAINSGIIQLQVNTTGTLSPLTITNLNFTTTGCTNAATDISGIKVFYTGTSPNFATTTQFGSTVTTTGSLSFTGTATLGEGTNYFWLTYNISNTATIGDALKACCTSFSGSGISSATPSITCPSGTQTVYQAGIWTAVTANCPASSLGHMMLMSDGTVLCKTSAGGSDGYGNQMYKLTPNASGSYVGGTWSAIAPMIDTRLWYSSQVLKDGRLYVAGGEYGTGLNNAEVYNPLTNVWTTAGSPGRVSDANSAILEDGRVLQALVSGALTSTKIYDPSTNTYATGPTARGIHNESSWLKLPDNSILFVDRLTTNSERYIPATNTWIADGTIPVQLYDPYGDETGAAFLLPDGRGFFIGAWGHTAYYTPSGTTAAGTWAAGPDIPNGNAAPDAGAAMMINGKIICAVSPLPTSANHFPSPTTFYEFDYTTNSFTLISTPSGAASISSASYTSIFLDLPNGQVLYSQLGTSKYYVYTPAGSQLNAGTPTINANSIKQLTCDSFAISGNLFNGISEGACYGDDAQMNTNFPVIRLTNGSNVYYARTNNWNSTGVMRGTANDTTYFKLPSGLAAGNYNLVVTSNGYASAPLSFNTQATLTSSLTPSAVCSGTTFNYTPTSNRTNATYSWIRAAVAGISNAAVTTAQNGNISETLVNTTSSPITVVYAVTITTGTCSNTQNVSVVINPTSSSTTNITACNNYTWNGTTYNTSGTYTYTTTNSAGCDSVATLNLTISPNYTIASGAGANGSISPNGNTSVCTGGNQVYTITPNTGYHIQDLLVDGASVGAISSYTFSNVTVNHTISASFSANCINTTSTTNVSVCSNSLPYLWNGNNYNTAGTYTIHLTNSCGSDSAATLILTVNAATSSNTTTNVCINQLPFMWNGLNITDAGTYTVHLINVAGCDSSATLTVIVGNAVTPVVTINGASSICSNQSVTYTAIATDGGASPNYQWKKNGINAGTGSSITFNAGSIANNDVISCVLTANNACQTTAIANSNNITVTVIPNPAAASITSQYGNNTTAYTNCNAGVVVSLYPSVGGGVWSSSNSNIVSVVNAGITTSTANATSGNNGLATLSYKLTTPNSNCSTVSAIAVTVAKQDIPSIIAGTSSLCVGSSATYTTSAMGGVWSTQGRASINQSGVALGSSAGSTNIVYTITNAAGCSASRTLPITVYAQPTIPGIAFAAGTTGITGNGGYCTNRTFTLVGSPVGGAWSKTGAISITSGGVVTTTSLTGAASATYTITNANGCSNSRIISTAIVACSPRGVNASVANSNEQWVIYPNPAHNVINLNVKMLVGKGSIVLTDLYGKQLKQQPLSIGTNAIDVSNFAKGMYLVSIITEQGKRTEKVVVE